MNADHAPNPLDHPQYLRNETRRIRQIIQTLTDPDQKKELAARSFDLAQRAEAISRIAEDPAITRLNMERYRSMLLSDLDQAERQTIQDLLAHSEDALNAHSTLRQLAAWYRSYAERAGNPAIWEARLLTAEDLEAEAARLERCNRVDPSHSNEPTGD